MKQTNNTPDNNLIDSNAEELVMHLQTLYDSLDCRSEQISLRTEAMPQIAFQRSRHLPFYVAAVGIAASIAVIIYTTCIIPPKHYDADALQSITLLLNQI